MQILVASDNQDTSRKVWHVLQRQGFTAQTARMARLDDAVVSTAQMRPDAILLVLAPAAHRALKVLDELRVITHVPVLGIGPGSDAKLILQTLRKGALQYLDENDLHAELETALQRLGPQHVDQESPGRVITVMGPAGGSGATTLAVNIATSLAADHESCALIDMKLEAGDLSAMLDLSPVHTLADFCDNISRMDRSMFQRCLVAHSSGVQLLAAPAAIQDVERVTVAGIRKALIMAGSLFPYTVIDLDHTYRPEHAEAVFRADIILLVLRLDIISLRQTRRSLDYLDQQGIEPSRVQLVVNRYRWRKELRISQVERALDRKIRYYVPDDPITLQRANQRGVPVVLERPDSKLAKSIQNIAHNVNGAHEPKKLLTPGGDE